MRLRGNVLILVGLGYLTITVGFVTMVYGGGSPAEVYDTIKEPLMALIGGSLALAKDVLGADDDNTPTSSPEAED